jgi:uncharacterized HAD superfamily protein/hypoxanthine phosphoribosyltransferase
MTNYDSSRYKPTAADLWEIKDNPAKLEVFASTTFRFRSINDLNRLIKSKLHTISGSYDLIVGIPRSGLLAANIAALHLNLPLLTLDEVKDISAAKLRMSRSTWTYESWKPGSPLRVLIVDDSTNSGNSLRRARQLISSQSAMKGATVHYMAIYATQESIKETDLYFQVVEQPRIFEWNFMHHAHAQNFLFDMDGVLCEDGPAESAENMDGYIYHLENARPKIIPSLKVGAIVTSRLERYRAQTEAWLRKHRVSYRYLIMTNLPTAEERRRLSLHGRFKADVYKRLGGSLFIESETWQAKEIATITGKAVYNLQDCEFIPATT